MKTTWGTFKERELFFSIEEVRRDAELRNALRRAGFIGEDEMVVTITGKPVPRRLQPLVDRYFAGQVSLQRLTKLLDRCDD